MILVYSELIYLSNHKQQRYIKFIFINIAFLRLLSIGPLYFASFCRMFVCKTYLILISLLRHEQLCLLRLCFTRYLLKYHAKRSLIKHTCLLPEKMLFYEH